MRCLGDMYRNGEGIEKPDYRTAVEWYEKAAEKGNASAMAELGSIYYQGLGLVKPDYRAAFQWYKKAAGKGNSLVMDVLDKMCKKGLRTRQDYDEALQLFTRAPETTT